MALTKNEMRKLKLACDQLEDGPDYQVNDYVKNLMNTVLDFRMHYRTIDLAMEYYEKKHGYREHKELKAFMDKFPNTRDGNLRLANSLWNNNHWTRAKFLKKLLVEFELRGIIDQESLRNWITQANFEEDVKGKFKTEEHSMGIALFHWLCIRLGIDTVKPDVHIQNFVRDAVGRTVSQQETVDSLCEVALQTKRSASRLDAAIWRYQKGW